MDILVLEKALSSIKTLMFLNFFITVAILLMVVYNKIEGKSNEIN